MEGQETEVKTQEQGIAEMVDAAFDAKEPAQESSPEKVQTEAKTENGPAPVKTEGSEQASEGEADKGTPQSVPYERFQEVIRKNQESQRQLEEFKRRLEILDDPAKLRAHLDKATPKQQEDMLAIVAEKLGWPSLSKLPAEQIEQLRDLVRTIEVVSELKAKRQVEPIEKFVHTSQAERATQKQFSEAQAFAKEYGFDWEKEMLPAIAKELDDLDQKDPNHTKPFDLTQFVQQFALKTLKERVKLQGRQEDRDKAKETLKPLKPGAPAQAQVKGRPSIHNKKEMDAWLESQIDALGFKE